MSEKITSNQKQEREPDPLKSSSLSLENKLLLNRFLEETSTNGVKAQYQQELNRRLKETKWTEFEASLKWVNPETNQEGGQFVKAVIGTLAHFGVSIDEKIIHEESEFDVCKMPNDSILFIYANDYKKLH